MINVDTFQLLAPASQNSSGNAGVGTPVDTATMMAVILDITDGSGTVDEFKFWLEGCCDELGSVWAAISPDYIVSGTALVASAPLICNTSGITPARYIAVFRHLPFTMVRPRWTLTGTDPSLTFAAYASVK